MFNKRQLDHARHIAALLNDLIASHSLTVGLPMPLEAAKSRMKEAIVRYERSPSLFTAHQALKLCVEYNDRYTTKDQAQKDVLAAGKELLEAMEAELNRSSDYRVDLEGLDKHEQYHALIKGFLKPLNEEVAKGNMNALNAANSINDQLRKHRDVFDPANLTIERHRISATHGTVTLAYKDELGEICLGLNQPDNRHPGAVSGCEGGTDAEWTEIARQAFNSGNPHGHPYRTRHWDEVREQLFKAMEVSLAFDIPGMESIRDQVEEVLSADSPHEYKSYLTWRLRSTSQNYESVETFRKAHSGSDWVELPMGEQTIACFASEKHRAVVTCAYGNGRAQAIKREAYTDEGFSEALVKPVRMSLHAAPHQLRQLEQSFINDYGRASELIRQCKEGREVLPNETPKATEVVHVSPASTAVQGSLSL